jgi:DNA-binding transcriptional ArsR family regulator
MAEKPHRKPSSKPTGDPRVLRALAHPVRNRILDELSASGPLRAADVAEDLGIPANQASFHLRSLAKYGLVEEDLEAARDRRDRVWRLTQQEGWSIDLGEIEKAPGGKAASTVFRHQRAAEAHAIVEEAFGDRREPDTHRSITDGALRLTKDEADQFTKESSELINRWNERTRGRDPRRRTYTLLQILQPRDDIAAEE